MPTFNSISNRVNRRGKKRPTVGYTFKSFHGFTLSAGSTALKEILATPEVEYVEQDAVVTISAQQNSPPSWGLPRVSRRKPLTTTNTPYLYNSAAGTGITAYVIDTGINTAHSEFGGRATMGANFITGSPNTDEHGHGTHVAGTIGGTNYGVAKKVRIVGVKVLAKNGSGSNAGVIKGMDWVVSKAKGKRAVVNMSLGGGKSQAVNDAAKRLFLANIPLFAAAGNDETIDACNHSPGGAPTAYTVGATDINDNIASFSSPGKCVDIFAPGVSIRSAYIGSNTATVIMSGTSMATPHVAGVAALVMSTETSLKTSKAVFDRLTTLSSKNYVKGNLNGSPNRLVYNKALN